MASTRIDGSQLADLTGDVTGPGDATVAGKLNGVTISGTPAVGDVITATSSTAATWSAPAAGSGGGSSTWTKYTVTYATLSAAANTNSVTLLSLPAKGMVKQVVIKHSASFTGGAITAYTVSVGITGDLQKYATNFDVLQAVSDTTAKVSNDGFIENFGTTTNILVTAISTGALLNAATAGSVDIWVLESTLP